MKRILYLANARIPTEKAHGIQIMKMCEAFAMEGNAVTLVVPWRWNVISDDAFRYYRVRHNFKIVRLPAVDIGVSYRIGFWFHLVTFTVSSFIYTLFSNADVIYSRDEFLLLPATFLRKKVIWEVHMPRTNFIAKLVARRVKIIVVISKGLKTFFADAGLSKSKLYVAHDAVDLDQFAVEVSKQEARNALGIPLHRKVLMYFGRIDSWKGVRTLAEASTKLGSDISIYVVGEGNDRDILSKQYSKVSFLGPRPYADLPKYQQAADILIVPNSGTSVVSRLYTSPLKIFAHMASGIPMIVSDLPSMREILSEESAIFADADNSDSFARAVTSVFDNYEAAEEKASVAKELVQNYTWRSRAQNITRLF